jgi:hypothetical protein
MREHAATRLPPPSASAWLHASVALAGSALGLAASAFYVRRSQVLADPWAMKMAIHMAGWHLLLTLTLFPASVWGQRPGIRVVQSVSLIFFLIHAGIGIANLIGPGSSADGGWIAALNGASGLAFLAAVFFGQRAHADMAPFQNHPSRR